MVLGKQESRVKENLKEVENKINQMLKVTQSTTQKLFNFYIKFLVRNNNPNI